MKDITGCRIVYDNYGGSERKFAIYIDGERYMVKEPDTIREKNNELSYMNNTFSEHIGCLIFQSVGIPTQETSLAKYTRSDGKEEIVVLCKDFKKPGEQLYEAKEIAKRIFDSKSKKVADFTEIQMIFDQVKSDLSGDAEKRFWDTFVVDCLIGNKDRHLGNWGFLSSDENHLTLAPVYDCGSTLAAVADDAAIERRLVDPVELKEAEGNIYASFTQNGKRVTYKEVFANPSPKLQASMKDIIPKINMAKIREIIENTKGFSESRKQYILAGIKLRYESILVRSLKRLQKREQEAHKDKSLSR